MKQSDLEQYYRDLREYQYDNNQQYKHIELRKKLNPVLKQLLRIERKLDKQQLTIMKDNHQKTDKPKIYAVTHVGRYDIEDALASIDSSAFFLMGDPRDTYKSIDYLFLKANGVIMFDTDNNIDRHIAKENCVKVLKSGGNILMFPEGAWNITENKPVMQLFNGAVEMAIRCNAEIIPIAIETYDNNYYANIGHNINYEDKSLLDVDFLNKELRDNMASLKWDIWESIGQPISRAKMDEHEDQKYIDGIMRLTENGYTVDEIERTRYHDRVPEREKAQEYLADIELNKNNSFLYDDLTVAERKVLTKNLIKRH